jgi:hypothetical protein
LEVFYRVWPEDANIIPLFKQIYEDIENSIEHLPGTWFTRKILYKEWYKSDIYFTLYLDSILLSFDKSDDELMQCRKFVLEQKKFSEEIINNKVKEYFKIR